jgi:hypothetical protein
MIKINIFYQCDSTANEIIFEVDLPAVPNVGNFLLMPHERGNLNLEVTEVQFSANIETVRLFCVNPDCSPSFYQFTEEEYEKDIILWYKQIGAINELMDYNEYVENIPYIRSLYSESKA